MKYSSIPRGKKSMWQTPVKYARHSTEQKFNGAPRAGSPLRFDRRKKQDTKGYGGEEMKCAVGDTVNAQKRGFGDKFG